MKDQQLETLIGELNRLSSTEKVKVWKRIAQELGKPTRRRRVVNVSKIEKYAKDGETVIVPGKVLGSGSVSRKLSVAAYAFSEQAKAKILDSKGAVMSIDELTQKNPNGKKLRIIG